MNWIAIDPRLSVSVILPSYSSSPIRPEGLRMDLAVDSPETRDSSMRPEGPWPIALRHAYAALHFKVSRPLTPAAALHYQFVSLRLVLVVARGTSSYTDVL